MIGPVIRRALAYAGLVAALVVVALIVAVS